MNKIIGIQIVVVGSLYVKNVLSYKVQKLHTVFLFFNLCDWPNTLLTFCMVRILLFFFYSVCIQFRGDRAFVYILVCMCHTNTDSYIIIIASIWLNIGDDSVMVVYTMTIVYIYRQQRQQWKWQRCVVYYVHVWLVWFILYSVVSGRLMGRRRRLCSLPTSASILFLI